MSDRNPVTTIGFDADDTLWHNERFFKASERRLCELLADRAEPDAVMTCLLAVERRNVGIYGFGIKGFTLSMIETALEVGEGATPPAVIAEIVALGRRMLELPVEILPGVRETLDALAGRYRLLLITKGDLQDQERKLGGSGLAGMFAAVEIVSDKSAGTYADAFSRHGDGAERGLMVGEFPALGHTAGARGRGLRRACAARSQLGLRDERRRPRSRPSQTLRGPGNPRRRRRGRGTRRLRTLSHPSILWVRPE